MKLIFLIQFLVILQLSFSQTVVNVDVQQSVPAHHLILMPNGQPAVPHKYIKVVEGSPFFNTEFQNATIVFPQGKNLPNQKVKINLLETELHYLDKEQEMIATVPVSMVILDDIITQTQNVFWHHKSFKDSLNKTAKGWYRQLCDGNIKLFVLQKKTISEFTPYGSSIAEQKIKNITEYYILKENKLTEVKKWSELPILLGNADLINNYIKEQKLKGKKEADYTSVVNFANEQK